MTRDLTTVVYLIVAVALTPAFAQNPGSQRAQETGVGTTEHGNGNGEAVDVQTIVSRLQQAQQENRENLRPYTVIRDYRLYSDSKQNANSEVTAQISFVPPELKHYVIKNTEGSDRGEKVVRKVLDGESKTSKQDNRQRDLTPENYTFTYVGSENLDGHSCYVLGIHPKRKSESLVDGKVWIDQQTYLPHKIEGEMAKNPSWWLKHVHLDFTFNDVKGMWLTTATQAIADVRFFGRHTLTSQAVDFQTAEAVAQNRAPRVSATAQRIAPTPVQNVRAPSTRTQKPRSWPSARLAGTGLLQR